VKNKLIVCLKNLDNLDVIIDTANPNGLTVTWDTKDCPFTEEQIKKEINMLLGIKKKPFSLIQFLKKLFRRNN
jgi:hypothetical protein